MASPILVTGATGTTGLAATKELLQRALSVRAFVHTNDDRARQLEAQGAEIFVEDLLDLRSVRRALAGVKRAYFVYPVRPGLIDATANFAQAAREAKVEFIINMSQITAWPDAPSNAARNHWVADRVFDWARTPVTHLQPTMFHKLLVFSRKTIIEAGVFGVFFGPSGKFASVSTEDLGLLIATMLANPSDHGGKTYQFFGPEELTAPGTAEVLSKTLGRKIRYEQVSADDFIKSFAGGKSIPYLEQHFNGAAQMHHDGVLAGTNDSLEKIIGRRPESLVEFIEKNRGFWEVK
ncbi:hypothetical protein F5884DRAFT_853865 [Xylogone sp. PMI_703]|nr:hypothetical protein F5884DRAFT_853865 [Xylogone sp. PMI_703]